MSATITSSCLATATVTLAFFLAQTHSLINPEPIQDPSTRDVLITLKQVPEVPILEDVNLGHLQGASLRQAVRDILYTSSNASQSEVLQAAADANISCTGFWIANVITCRGVPQSFVHQLQDTNRFEKIQRVQPLGVLRRIKFEQVLPFSKTVSSIGELPRDAGWNVNLVGAPRVWNITRGDGITVAIIDGGVRHTHEALVESFRGTLPASKSQSVSNTPKFDFDYNWYDPVYKSKSPEGSDTDGHGTHVTGTVAGSKGIGAAPGAKWIHAKACNYAGYCSDDWALETAQWVMCPTPVGSGASDCSKGAEIVSCSWGNEPGGDSYLFNVTQAWESAGILGVFAVGNSGPECGSAASPADYPSSLSVGATDKNDDLVDFSSRGPSDKSVWNETVPSLVAPGLLVPSSYYDGDDSYYHLSGTSQACPLVAGTAALVRSVNPALTPAQVRQIIESSSTTTTLSLPSSGKSQCGASPWNVFPNDIYGAGRLDAEAAVKAALHFVDEDN